MRSLDQLVDFLGDRALSVHGDTSIEVEGFAPAIPGRVGAISFIIGRSRDALQVIDSSASSAFLVPPGVVSSGDCAKAVIEVSSPRLEFARLGHEFFPVETFSNSEGIHPNASVGVGTVIGPGTIVESGVAIGRHCAIGPNVVIRSRSVIGDRVRIGPGSVIGEPGFGFERDETGRALRLPHYGSVRIGDDVEVGAHVVIDRGVFVDTTIGSGAKIDSLVLVGHNVMVGEDAFVIGGSVLCGGVVVGKRAWVAPGSTVMEKVTIGDDATVGIGSTVCRDVPEQGSVMGAVARPALRLGG